MMANQATRYYGKDRKRRRCILCGQAATCGAMRWSPSNHNLLAVMLSSQVAFGGVDVRNARFCFEACVTVRKRLCRKHFSDGARYVVVELATIGVSLSHYADGAFLPTAAAYVNERDISKDLVDRLNKIVEQFDVRCITAKDVMKFVNQSLWRYYNETGLDPLSGLFTETQANNLRKDDLHSKEAVQDVFYANDIKQEEESDNSDYGIPLSELAGPSFSSSSSVKEEPYSDAVDFAWVPNAVLTRRLPKLEKTEPALLLRSFAIGGESLLKLFRFCPQCEQKLSTDGAVRLVMDGAAPTVQYVCDRCSEEGPLVKSWKIEEDQALSK